jgi:eukaryotic-like serine/threonine-protein kinase
MPANDPKAMTIVAEALKRPDRAARAAHLDSVCGDDADFRAQVEALLATHDAAGRPVEADVTGMYEPTSPETIDQTPAPDAATLPPSARATGEQRSDGADLALAVAPRVDSPGRSGVGQVIASRYTLREVLGEGGMGTVYRADQTAPVKRQVALKLIKIGMDSRAVLARFDAERQALALMEHPNIARVYDGGTTEVGQPFFAMELVSGEPITDYCDRKRLPVRARLELFVSVCQAVQHAHQKGIIHRDLKPSNVMVTEVDGRATPKVIDFGVAKATEFNLTDQSLADTGAIVGTPT